MNDQNSWSFLNGKSLLCVTLSLAVTAHVLILTFKILASTEIV
jgi:hypothetical protein